MNPQGDPSGIYVPIEIDTSKATEQFKTFADTVKKTELRPNSDLEDFLAGISSNATSASSGIRQMAMNMRLLGQSARAASSSGVLTESQRNAGKPYRMPSLSGPRPGTMDMGILSSTVAANAAALVQARQAREDEYRNRLSSLSVAAPFRFDMGSAGQVARGHAEEQARLKQAHNDEYRTRFANLSGESPFTMDVGRMGQVAKDNAAMLLQQKQAHNDEYRTRFSKLYGATPGSMDMNKLGEQYRNEQQRKKNASSNYVDVLNANRNKPNRFSELINGQGIGNYAGTTGMRSLGAASTAGKYSVAAAAGVTASGFSGTVEGERFAREMRVLSLELAGAFKPLMDTVTNVTRSARQKLQNMNQDQQDDLMKGGLAIAGALLGARVGRIFGTPGAIAGGLIGGFAGAKGLDVNESYRVKQIMEGSTRSENYQRNRDLFDMDPESRMKEIDRRQKRLYEEAKRTADEAKQFKEGTREYNERGKEVAAFKEESNALSEIQRRTKTGESLEELKKQADTSRRQVMLTEGVGFAGAGSTFQAIQEDVLRTSVSEAQTTNEKLQKVVDEMKDVNTNLKALNK